jgi:hypothetical protein
MGIEIGRIEKEFILTAVFDKQMPVNVHGQKKERTGIITALSDSEIEIESRVEGWEDFSKKEDVRIFFAYYGHVMTFHSTVLEVNDMLKVQYPASIHKNLQRKFERVPPPEGSTIDFEVEDLKVEMDYPKTEEFDPVVKLELSEQFEPSNIDALIGNFRKRMERYSDENTIQMFREKRPEHTEELLIAQTGKILFVPNTSESFPKDDILWDERVLTHETLVEIEKTGLDERLGDFSSHHLDEFLEEKRRKGIRAFLYCPIIYHEYVVGYIRLVCDDESEKTITIDAIDFIYEFSRVLAYSLKIHGYFKTEGPLSNRFEARIIDISASGLLFVHPSPQLKTSLSLYKDINLRLMLPPRSMRIGSRIMRKYSDKDVTYFGVQYITVEPEDFRYLFDLVYGRPYTTEDEEKWEGGAAPPELNLDL